MKSGGAVSGGRQLSVQLQASIPRHIKTGVKSDLHQRQTGHQHENVSCAPAHTHDKVRLLSSKAPAEHKPNPPVGDTLLPTAERRRCPSMLAAALTEPPLPAAAPPQMLSWLPRPAASRSNLNFGPMAGALGMGVVRTLSIMPYSMASLGSIHLLRDSSRITWGYGKTGRGKE